MFTVPHYIKRYSFYYYMYCTVSRWHLKCFVKLWVSIDLVEYHHSPVVKVPVLGL